MNGTPVVRLRDLVVTSGRKAGPAGIDLPVHSVTKHRGFVPSLEYFKKQVFSRDLSNYRRVESGEFAYATIHLDEGSIGIAETECLISPMYTIFKVTNRSVHAPYLLRYLKSPRALTEYSRLGKGSVHRRRSISFAALSQMSIPLPPMQEQLRIASILDQADVLRARRREALANLDHLTQCIFLDMFGADRADSRLTPFRDVCSRVTVGVVVRPASYYVESGVPALRSLNVKPGKIHLDDLVHFSQSDNDTVLSKSKLRSGDLVIVRTGQPGAAAVVPLALEGANAIDLIVATPRREIVLATFLANWLNSSVGKAMVSGAQRGQIQQHFNVGSLNQAQVPVPPRNIQVVFGERVEAIDRLRASQANQLAELDVAFASLQSRAFAGDL